MAIAARMQNTGRKSIAVIGDGAMTAGMAFEALNHAGHLHADMLVVLNDNDMSISRNVGGLSNYFAKLLSSRTYNQVRDSSKKVLKGTPHLMALAKKTEEHFKGMIAPGTLFEELGFNYIGPIDGHDLPLLVETLENIRELEGPQFLHVVTTKGKGFAPAEADPIGYHAINKIEPVPASKPEPVKPKPASPKYANVFGQWLCDAAEQDSRVAGITPPCARVQTCWPFQSVSRIAILMSPLPSSMPSPWRQVWLAMVPSRSWPFTQHFCSEPMTSWYTMSPSRTWTSCLPLIVRAWSAKTAPPTLAPSTSAIYAAFPTCW